MKLWHDLLMTDYGLMSLIVVVMMVVAMLVFAVVIYRRANKKE